MGLRTLGGWLGRADRLLRQVEDGLLLVLLAGLILLASAQIVLRNVFSIGLVWADGTVRLGVLWLALLGAMAAAREGRHIAIDVLARTLPPTPRKLVRALTALFAAGVCGILAWYSWRFVQDSRAFGDVLLDHWPAWVFQLIMPVGFGLIALRFLLQAGGLAGGAEAPAPVAGPAAAGPADPKTWAAPAQPSVEGPEMAPAETRVGTGDRVEKDPARAGSHSGRGG